VAVAARAPGKLVALGEYAVLEGAPALVLAVDRYASAVISLSDDGACHLRTLFPQPTERAFEPGEPSGSELIDLVTAASPAAAAWRGTLESSAFYDGPTKLGIGSSAAALCAWAGAWAAHARRAGSAIAAPTLDSLIALHRRFQGGKGSGIDVAASFSGGVLEFALGPAGSTHIGSVRLPNSVGFAGIFAGRSASTPALVARYRDWRSSRPAEAAAIHRRLSATAEAGCTAARGNAAGAFIEAIAEYGRGLQDLGVAIGADIVTAEHREIGEHARRHGVAYKVSGAGGGDLGFACALDAQALEAFKKSVGSRGFRVIDFGLAESGLFVDERAGDRSGGGS
jgi:phosphomevalonate kinase